MKNSIEEDKEILNNIKAYMQENIDKGYHKFIYNDLGYEEKCIDVINAIEHILSDYKRVLKENEELKNKKENENEMIFDGETYFCFIDKLEIRGANYESIRMKGEKTMEEVKSIEEFRDYLIGQKEGLQFALDMTNIQVKSLQNSITMIEEKLKNFEK